MSKHILKGLYQFAVYTIGICVLLAAVTATLIRLLLPDIGMYRTEIEAWVSNYMDFPVAIHTIEADWQGWTPSLYLQDIDLLNKAGTGTIINFDAAQVSIDPLATLLRRQIVPKRLMISGFDINLTRKIDGSIDVEGIESNTSQQQGNTDNELAEWLFGQRIIELQHANIVWLDENLGNAPVELNGVNLIMRSDGNRLQIDGSSPLPSIYGERLSFAIDATGDLLTADWSAELYIEGNNINPDFWYRKYWPAGISVIGGKATVTVWSSWKNARVTSMQGKLEYDDFEFGVVNGTRLQIQQLDTRFSTRKNPDNSWQVNLGIEQLTTRNGSWEPSQISLLANPVSPSYTLNFDYLKLDDIYPVLSTLSLLPARYADITASHTLQGVMRDGHIEYTPDTDPADKLKFDISFSEINMAATTKLPGISGLSARARGSLDKGLISFSDENTVIRSSTADDTGALPYSIHGDLAWSATDSGHVLFTDLLKIGNQDINTRWSGSVSQTGICCYINMIAEADTTSVDSLIKNLPYTESFRLRDWLQRSVHKGEVRSIKAVFRGSTGNFPFDNHAGVFELDVNVAGASLTYSPRWPSIEYIDGDVRFAGRVMTINIDKGSIFNATIATATATVPDLLVRQKTVNIEGQISGLTSDLKQYIGQSPLSSNSMLAKLSDSISADGDVDLELQLSVPLRTPGKQTSINGKLTLARTTLTSDLQGLQFTDIAGDVLFTRDTLTTDDLVATYAGKDIRLSVNASQSNSANPVKMAVSGEGDTAFIHEQISRYFPKLASVSNSVTNNLSGTTEWQAILTYNRNNTGPGLNRTLKISSDLYGMNVNLPQPLTKHAYIKTNLEITKDLDDKQAPLKIRYGDILSSEIRFNSTDGMLKADVNFGNRTYIYPDHEGILLYGVIDQMALDDWFALLGSREQSGNSSNDIIPLQTDLTFNNLYSLGQTFKNVSVNVRHAGNNWNVQLASDAVNGDITIPDIQDQDQPIIVNLKNLWLQKPSGTGNGKRINPVKFPSITAQVESFHYGNLDLGKMEFIAGSADYGLYIDTISFTKPSFTIEASGKWNGTDTINHSSDFTIQAHADEFDKMLETFGYDVAAVKKGETYFAIDANWDGTPMDFSLARLNGTLGLKIGKGQLLDIQPSAGRLFGLLSLQTLPRRLTLDFSDLFGDGMAFDLIEGNFVIRNGDAYTDDLVLKGPSVDIAITGRTGLSTHDYDQTATVTPQISDSIAVASGFLGPMGIGLGTILYFAGNMFEPLQDSINKIMKFRYSISGSWNDPVIEKHRDAPKSSG